MKTILASSLAFAIMTAAALAQVAAPAPAGLEPPPTPTAAADAPGAGAPPPRGGPRPGGPAEGGPDGHRPSPPPRGAHIRLQRGDLLVDVGCAEDEPMRSCAEITSQMLDHLSAASTAPTAPKL